MLTVKVDTENAAFREDSGEETGEAMRAECAAILRRVAGDLLNGSDSGALMDSNGNRVGSWELTD